MLGEYMYAHKEDPLTVIMGQNENQVMEFLLHARCLQRTGELLRHGCRPQSTWESTSERETATESNWSPRRREELIRRQAGARSGRPRKPNSVAVTSNYHCFKAYNMPGTRLAISMHSPALWYLLSHMRKLILRTMK